MRIYGLTGGIASGKSTVRQMLEQLGAPVVDADQLSRHVVRPGSASLAQVAKRFPGVLRKDGTLDRAKLAARIFPNPKERKALNDLLHPAIRVAFQEQRARYEARGTPVLVYDAALLLESGATDFLDGVLLVVLEPELQKARMMTRDGLTEKQAEDRLASQWTLAQKIPLARWLLDNSGTPEQTWEALQPIWAEMQAGI